MKTLTFDDFPEHDNARVHEQVEQFPQPGQIIPSGTGTAKVIRAKVVSAFWLTENVLMKQDVQIDPSLRYTQKRQQPTVLFLIEAEPTPA